MPSGSRKRGKPEAPTSVSSLVVSPKAKHQRSRQSADYQEQLLAYSASSTCVDDSPAYENTTGLPDDIWIEILKKLSVVDLANVIKTSRYLEQIGNDNAIWRSKARALELNTRFIPAGLSLKQHVMEYITFQAKHIIKLHFPKALIDAVGIFKLAEVPMLKLSQIKDYLDFITPDDLGSYPIRWGIDCAYRPFISFQFKLNHNQTSTTTAGIPHTLPEVFVETLFKRTNETGSYWYGAGGYDFLKRAQDSQYNLHPSFLNYVSRLVHGEPCGKLSFKPFKNKLVEKTTNDQGQSIVALYPHKP